MRPNIQYSEILTLDPPSKTSSFPKMNLLGDLSNITDPLDFKTTKIPKLFEIDSLLRCHICKEFISAPMLTSCGHTFCSVCIRKYLIHTPKCPICAKELRESNLSRNVLLEQVVLSYRSVRDDLLENLKIAKEIPKIKSNEPTQHSYDLDPNSNSIEVLDKEDEDYDDDVIIIDEPKKRKPEANGIESLFKKHKSETEKKGTCPICNKLLPLKVLESTHIDACLANPEPEVAIVPQPSTSSPSKRSTSIPTQSSTPASPSPYFQPKENNLNLKKLTKLDYPSLSTSGLKQKLTKLELPVAGTRNQLEQRYNEYLILWNANCDSVVPKNPKILRKQLAQWENSLKFKNGNSEKQLDENGWNLLIAQAKKTALKNKKEEGAEEKKESEKPKDENLETGKEEEDKKKPVEAEKVEAIDDSEADTTNEQFFKD